MKKVWSPLYIGIISYFCLVLPAVILWGINFRKMGRTDLVKPNFLIGIFLFIALILGWIFLPKSWDWGLEIFHVSISIAGAAIQYPIYRKFLEEDEDNRIVESLFPQALLSIFFLILCISTFFGWNWYLQHQTEKQLLQSKELYDLGDYPASITILKKLIEEDPGQRTAYLNMSIAYETMGKPDSAIVIMENWLNQMPEDGEAKERIYQLRYINKGK